MSETAYDKYPFFGEWTFDYSVPERWEPMIDTLCHNILHRMESLKLVPELLRVVQVKSKFGGLRFYYVLIEDLRDKGMRGYIDGAVSLAESLSYDIR